MTAIFSLLVVLTFSFLITRFGAAALVLTGVSRQLAQLQAISAFTGVGFTTSESEKIVSHPARRRVLITLMILGNAGIVTAVSTLILSFVGVTQRSQWISRGAILVVGLVLLWAVATNKWIEERMLNWLQSLLRRFTDLQAIDFVELLELTGPYCVRTMTVDRNDWVAGKRLDELQLLQEGVTVLGIHCGDGHYLGVPRGETTVHARDQLVLYGREQRLAELDERRSGVTGDAAHDEAISEQRQARREQRKVDARSERRG